MNVLLRFCVIIVISFSSDIRCHENSDNFEDIRHELNQFVSQEDRNLLNGLDIIDVIKQLNKLRLDIDDNKHDNQTCHNCVSALNNAKLVIKSADLMKSTANTVCKTVVDETDRVCVGTLTSMAEPIVYILQNSAITVPEMCGVLLHPDCMTHTGNEISHVVNWVLPLPHPKPFNPLQSVMSLTSKMLHLTDIHPDLYYTPGSNARCSEPMCCRSTSYGHNQSAGYWSDMSALCDAPCTFVSQTMRHIATAHRDLEFVIWSGDNVPHDAWNTSRQHNLDHIKAMTTMVKEELGDKRIFPGVGNHEPHPFNMYVPLEAALMSEGNHSMGWLYDTLADNYWSQWIDTPEAKRSFKKGGYYSIQYTPGLKIIVLNNNVCIKRNYWLAYQPVDPDDQLQWLIGQLDSAETDGSYAMLIMHLPLYYCYNSWANNYMKIVERYRNVITSTYHGHTHFDEIQVLYNKNISTGQLYPVSHGYIGSSLSTFNHDAAVNPGYKIFTLNSNGKPLDIDIYYTNITADNIAGQHVSPVWRSDESVKRMYGLQSLTTDSWHQFLMRAQTDDTIIGHYFNHFHRYSDPFVMDLKRKGIYNTIGLRKYLNKRSYIVNPVYDHVK